MKFHSPEKWATLRGYKGADGQRYAVSNFGRIIAYWDTFNNGYFMKYSFNGKYPGIQLRKAGTGKGFLVHRLVAEHFCKKPSSKHKIVLHADHKKENNHYQNLKWATAEEAIAHMKKDPNYIKARLGKGHKLTIDRVKLIKRKLQEGKTRIKILCKQFGISDTMINRIKTGENWGHVKI
ncbi:MAG: NUMOD4 domain-containing protein [Flammeovirgaceae bacterium]|nr:NUMOD4 domain-containing protein [Flammeovirgaceae bacterium]